MLFNRKILYDGKSDYGSYRVVDAPYNGREARLLYGNRNSAQSGKALDNDPELLFDYNQRFLEMIKSTAPKHILVIGGGAFMLPTAAFQMFSDLKISVVEIDQLLVDISRDYFDLPNDPRYRVFVDDALDFLRKTNDMYDAIIIDAFSGYDVPAHLLEKIAIEMYKNHVAKNGFVAMNFISEYKPNREKLAHEIIASFSEIFPSLSLYQSDPEYRRGEEQNLVLVAGESYVNFDYLAGEEIPLFSLEK